MVALPPLPSAPAIPSLLLLSPLTHRRRMSPPTLLNPLHPPEPPDPPDLPDLLLLTQLSSSSLTPGSFSAAAAPRKLALCFAVFPSSIYRASIIGVLFSCSCSIDAGFTLPLLPLDPQPSLPNLAPPPPLPISPANPESHFPPFALFSLQLLITTALPRTWLSPVLEMPSIKPIPPDPPVPPDQICIFTPPIVLLRYLLVVLSNQPMFFLVPKDWIPLLPRYGMKPWFLLLRVVSVAMGKVFNTFWTSMELTDPSLGLNSYYYNVQSVSLPPYEVFWLSSSSICEPFSAIFIVVVRPSTAFGLFPIAFMRSITTGCKLSSIVFMDLCVLVLDSPSWCLIEGVLPTNSFVPLNLVHLDNCCPLFPNVPLIFSGLDAQDSPVLQGFSSRYVVSPAFVAGFFSAFVADIFSVLDAEPNAFSSVSDAADQNVHGILVSFDSSCFLLIKCIYFYLLYIASCLAKLWALLALYFVIPTPFNGV